MYSNAPKTNVMANSIDPDQTAVWSGSTLFAQICLMENLGPLWYIIMFTGPVPWNGDRLTDDEGLELWYQLLQVRNGDRLTDDQGLELWDQLLRVLGSVFASILHQK